MQINEVIFGAFLGIAVDYYILPMLFVYIFWRFSPTITTRLPTPTADILSIIWIGLIFTTFTSCGDPTVGIERGVQRYYTALNERNSETLLSAFHPKGEAIKSYNSRSIDNLWRVLGNVNYNAVVKKIEITSVKNGTASVRVALSISQSDEGESDSESRMTLEMDGSEWRIYEIYP